MCAPCLVIIFDALSLFSLCIDGVSADSHASLFILCNQQSACVSTASQSDADLFASYIVHRSMSWAFLLMRPAAAFLSSVCPSPPKWWSCRHRNKILCDLQNPVLTTVWALVLCQIILPLLSFGVDTNSFVSKFSKAEVILATAYATFGLVCAFVGPAWFDVTDLYNFYHLDFSFTWKLDLVGWAFFVIYFGVLTVTRRLWDVYEVRMSRVTPYHV